jgi:hypothetical protein
MAIDIDNLTEQELRDLNHRVVERLKFLRDMKAHQSMMRFNIGSKVVFETGEGRVFGTLFKFNKKTVSILTEDNVQWNVAPQLLSLVKDTDDILQENFLITTDEYTGK